MMFFSFFGFIALVIVIVAVIYFLQSGDKGKDIFQGLGKQREDPLEILKERYAKGEISKEEFDRMKKDLQSWRCLNLWSAG